MNIYCDYNLLGRYLDYQNENIGHSKIPGWDDDHHALGELLKLHKEKRITLEICKEDGLEEFVAFAPDKINSYNSIGAHLPLYLRKKFDLFDLLHHRELLIAPFGEYGFGHGPFGGGSGEQYALLNEIRKALGGKQHASPREDRDARHIMHSVSYNSDYFLTMDYKTIIDKLEPIPSPLAQYLESKNLRLRITHPAKLMMILAASTS